MPFIKAAVSATKGATKTAVKTSAKQSDELFGWVFRDLPEPQAKLMNDEFAKNRVVLSAPEFQDPSISHAAQTVFNEKVGGDFGALPFEQRVQQTRAFLKDQQVIDGIADHISFYESRDALKLYRKSTKGINQINKAYDYYAEHGNLQGFGEGKDVGTVVRTKKGQGFDYGGKRQGIQIETKSARNVDAGKRQKTTKLDIPEIERLGEKFNQPREVVLDFIRLQKNHKKTLESLVAKINKRIKDNPEYFENKYPKNPDGTGGLQASIGHGIAAKRFEHSGDIASNIELENFSINAKRSDKKELSDALNMILGRSFSLEEEFVKFIDPDLGEFWPKWSKKQKTQLIGMVASGWDANEAMQAVLEGVT